MALLGMMNAIGAWSDVDRSIFIWFIFAKKSIETHRIFGKRWCFADWRVYIYMEGLYRTAH